MPHTYVACPITNRFILCIVTYTHATQVYSGADNLNYLEISRVVCQKAA